MQMLKESEFIDWDDERVYLKEKGMNVVDSVLEKIVCCKDEQKQYTREDSI